MGHLIVGEGTIVPKHVQYLSGLLLGNIQTM